MERETFSSGWGTLLATAGVAIGLGNVWRFPYMMGLYGGSAFLLVYLLIVFTLGVPALACEWALGRGGGRGVLGSLRSAGLPGAPYVGGLLLVTVTMAASYYGVVVAWVLDFAVLFAFSAAGGASLDAQSFGRLVAAPAWQLPGLAATVIAACLCLGAGVKRGIEKVSRAVLPLFFLLFVVLVVRAVTLPGAAHELTRYLAPDWSGLSAEMVLAALGQAFFSLALGGTFMVVYGGYLRRTTTERNLFAQAAATAITDAAAALLAALAVVPAVLALGLDMASGPPLLFEVVPEVFGRMPAGAWFGLLFFASVFLVALLSLMAAYEVVVQALTEHLGWPRRRALLVVGAGELVLAAPALVSLGYVEQSDFIWGSTMQPLGGAIAVVALVWFAGRRWAVAELGPQAARAPVWLWLRWVVPGAILASLAFGWWERWRG